MKTFLIILLVILARAYYKQLDENERLRQDYVSRGLRIDELKKENERLYSSLIKSEKETQKAEARASGFEAETERLQRTIDNKSKFIAQLEKKVKP